MSSRRQTTHQPNSRCLQRNLWNHTIPFVIFCFFIKMINTTTSELQLEFEWSRCPTFHRCQLVAILSNLETVFHVWCGCFFFFFQSTLSPVYKSTPRCFSCSATSNCYSVLMANLFCFLLQFTCMSNETECLVLCFFSGVFFGKGGVAELFTKQLCFIRRHTVVQYLVNSFSDN